MSSMVEKIASAPKNILLVGYGDIAHRFASQWCAMGHRGAGVARSKKTVHEHIDYWQGALQDAAIQARIRASAFDFVLVTLTPDGRDDEAYRLAYVENMRVLSALLRDHPTPPTQIIFVSSTGVYGQNQGEWVDETSLAQPHTDTGKRLLEAETILLDAGVNASIMRFSGIYGPGRDYLIRQVKAGMGGNDCFTNRIHIADCVGMLCLLFNRCIEGERLETYYIGSDCEPVLSREVRTWLAEALAIDPCSLRPSSSGRAANKLSSNKHGSNKHSGNKHGSNKQISNKYSSNKRCSNKRIVSAGYSFIYPTFREGYTALIKPSQNR